MITSVCSFVRFVQISITSRLKITAEQVFPYSCCCFFLFANAYSHPNNVVAVVVVVIVVHVHRLYTQSVNLILALASALPAYETKTVVFAHERVLCVIHANRESYTPFLLVYMFI